MVDKEDLESALVDLKERAAEDDTRSAILNEVADDWQLSPVLLARKFLERFKVSYDDYVCVDEDAQAIGVTLEAMKNDAVLFTRRQRCFVPQDENGKPGTPLFISGRLVTDTAGRKIVLRAISENLVSYFLAGTTHPESAPLARLFGSQEHLSRLLEASEPSRLEPEGFGEG